MERRTKPEAGEHEDTSARIRAACEDAHLFLGPQPSAPVPTPHPRRRTSAPRSINSGSLARRGAAARTLHAAATAIALSAASALPNLAYCSLLNTESRRRDEVWEEKARHLIVISDYEGVQLGVS